MRAALKQLQAIFELPVAVWLGGSRRAAIRVAGEPRIVRVEIDPEGAFPDLDRQNQVWTP